MDVVVHGVVDGHIHGAVVGHVLADQDLCHLWGIHVQHDWTWTRILEAAFARIDNDVIYNMDQIQLGFFSKKGLARWKIDVTLVVFTICYLQMHMQNSI